MTMHLQGVQNLFPMLAGREQAKRANEMALKAGSLQLLRQRASNESAINTLKAQVRETSRHNKKVSEQFAKSREAFFLNKAAADNQATYAKLEREVGKGAAEGILAAQNAARGVHGTGLAESINRAQAFRVGAVEGLSADTEAARKYNAAGTITGIVNSAFSQYKLDVPLVGLDYRDIQVKQHKVASAGWAAIKDVARLVATYYGGENATKAIDAVNDHEGKYQDRNATQQAALSYIYGPNAPQLRTASRPEYSKIVGAAGSANGYGGSQFGGGSGGGSFDWTSIGSAFTDQKTGNNGGLSGDQFGQLFGGFQSLFGSIFGGKSRSLGMPSTGGLSSTTYTQGFSIPKG